MEVIVERFFPEESILIFFKNHEGQITCNQMNQSDLWRSKDFVTFIQDLKYFLLIPQNKKLVSGFLWLEECEIYQCYLL